MIHSHNLHLEAWNRFRARCHMTCTRIYGLVKVVILARSCRLIAQIIISPLLAASPYIALIGSPAQRCSCYQLLYSRDGIICSWSWILSFPLNLAIQDQYSDAQLGRGFEVSRCSQLRVIYHTRFVVLSITKVCVSTLIGSVKIYSSMTLEPRSSSRVQNSVCTGIIYYIDRATVKASI